MSKQWRCAVVGTGLAGEWHVRDVPQLPNATLVAICEQNSTRARAVLDKYKLTGTPVYADLAEMLGKHPDIDVVHVCTPSGDHLNPATLAMRAGKNVIIEKPMEIRLDRIDQMAELAAKQGVRLAGIFQNRWHPANQAIKAAADEGRFGRIAWAGCFTPWYRTDQYYRDGGWRGTWKLDGGGAIMNQSVHAIDLLQWIVGPVKSVSAYASSRIHAEIEVEDTLSCAVQFESGAFGSIMGTTAMYPGLPARLEIGGENGTAISELGLKFFKFRDEREADRHLLEKLSPAAPEALTSRVLATGGQELLEKLKLRAPMTSGGGGSAADIGPPLHYQNIQSILRAWEVGRDAETSASEARKAVAIILAMYESARKNGQPIEIG